MAMIPTTVKASRRPSHLRLGTVDGMRGIVRLPCALLESHQNLIFPDPDPIIRRPTAKHSGLFVYNDMLHRALDIEVTRVAGAMKTVIRNKVYASRSFAFYSG